MNILAESPRRLADKLRTIFRESIISVDFAQNIVVIKTMAGLANAAAAGAGGHFS